MKKITAAPLAAAVLSLLFFSCGNFSDLGIPESVSVRSSAQYTGALGQKYFDLTERLGKEMLDKAAEESGGDVYSYISEAGDKTLKYLLRKKLYDIPLDIGEYLDGVNFDSEVNASLDFEKEIELPQISFSVSNPIVDVDVPEFDFEMAVNASFDPSVKEALIKTGSVTVRVQGSGDALSLASFSLAGIKKTDGTEYSQDDFEGDPQSGYLINQVLDLAGGVIDVGASQIKASGTLVKSGAINAGARLSCSMEVEELSRAVVDMNSFGGFEMNDTTDNKKRLSSDMISYVKSMDFGQESGGHYYKSDSDGNLTAAKGRGKGIQFTAVNSFPEGNDITVIIKSNVFGIDSKAASGFYVNGEEKVGGGAAIPATASQKRQALSFANYGALDITDQSRFGTKDNPAYVDFLIGLSDSQVLQDLKMGATYKVSVSGVETLMDWDKAVLALDNLETVSGASDMSDLSINSLLDGIDGELSKLVQNCDVASLPVYLFVQKPEGTLADLVQNISFEGKMYFSWTEGGAAKTKYLSGTESSLEALSFCKAFDWGSSDKTLVKKFERAGVDYSVADDISGVLNARGTQLKANYEIAVSRDSECELYKARLDSMSKDDTATIAVDMAAVLPLVFDVTADTELDVYELAEMDISEKSDLLDRSDVSSSEDYAKVADSISYLRLGYNVINSAVEGLDATISIDDRHGGDADYSGIQREIKFTGSDSSDDIVDFSSEEIKAIMTRFFLPEMKMTIAAGTRLSVLRNAADSKTSLGINPVVSLKLDENAPIDVKDLIK